MSEEDKTKRKKKSKTVVMFGNADEFDRIKQFCDEEALYMGRFLVRCAIRHIEEVERERIQKELARLK